MQGLPSDRILHRPFYYAANAAAGCRGTGINKQKSRRGRFCSAIPPRLQSGGKSPIPPRPACAGLLLPGVAPLSRSTSRMVRGSRQGGAAQKPLPAQALPQPRLPEPPKTKIPRPGGRSPARSFAAFGGQTARAKAPCSAASPAGAGAFPQKKQRTPPCVALRPLLFVWSYFFGSPLAKSGSAPSSPPGRKTRRPVFQPLCHACRMVSSAGAWQKE